MENRTQALLGLSFITILETVAVFYASSELLGWGAHAVTAAVVFVIMTSFYYLYRMTPPTLLNQRQTALKLTTICLGLFVVYAMAAHLS